ncbi:hypothetical protein PC128_g26673 [Phytophthora cactorum]|nr:hypothetical protein PC128_g26673 [Phytophthora cactorum]
MFCGSNRRLLRKSSSRRASARIEVPAQCTNVLCQEATERMAHHSCVQQADDATIPAQAPIPRKDVIIDSMAKSIIYSALDLRDGLHQILVRESDIPLTAVSTRSGMLW